LNQLDVPWAIYVDESDNNTLYVADYDNHRVMKWLANAINGTIVAGGNGCGTSYTQLCYPTGLFVDTFGTIYVGDSGNNRIMKWLKGATNGSLVAGTGIAGVTPMQLSDPIGIRFDMNGNLYVADYSNSRVQQFMFINTSCEPRMYSTFITSSSHSMSHREIFTSKNIFTLSSPIAL